MNSSPIIFLGFGRCGTTIISEIIFQHHKLAWISNYQQRFPKSKHINYLRRLFDNPFWHLVGQKEQLNKVGPFNRYFFKPTESYSFWNAITQRDFARDFLFKVTENKDKAKEIYSFFNAMVRFQNRERLSIKITGPSRMVYLKSIFPDAKFIHIKRNPLPNISSLMNVEFYQTRKNKLWWYGVYNNKELKRVEQWKNKYPELIAALQYYKVNTIFKEEKKNLDSQVLEVTYEDFIINPDRKISYILDFLELDQDERITKYLMRNKIYNRNQNYKHYFSDKLDSEILEIAQNGIE